MALYIGVVYCNHNWTSSHKASITAFEIIQNLNLPFYFVDSNKAIKPENQARDWRYKSFATILNNSHYDLLLTGHTLSDCAETILFNLCRGSGLKGVCSLKKFQIFESILPTKEPLEQHKKSAKEKFKYSHFQIHSFSLADLKYKKSPNLFFSQNCKVFYPKSIDWTPGKFLFTCYLKKKKSN